jgi:hypothetical protein
MLHRPQRVSRRVSRDRRGNLQTGQKPRFLPKPWVLSDRRPKFGCKRANLGDMTYIIEILEICPLSRGRRRPFAWRYSSRDPQLAGALVYTDGMAGPEMPA